jgi:hypothetical protein
MIRSRRRRQRQLDPPITGYTRSTTERRRVHPHLAPAPVVASVAVLLIALVAVFVVWRDNPAQSAADHAVAVSGAKPTAQPGPPVRKPVEQSPPLAESFGDGTWLVGKDIKAGTYRSRGGEQCYWARLSGLSGRFEDVIASGGWRRGPATVAIPVDDFAFGSQGCGIWELIVR